jgi:hypothetical protein
MDWLQILVNLILTGVLLYVFQRVIDERSARRLEEFKAELKSTAFERETKFSKLHEKRLQVLAELYRKLSHVNSNLSAMKLTAESGIPDDHMKLLIDDFNKAIDEFSAYLSENRLYLPDHLCDQLYLYWAYSIGVWSNLSTSYITNDHSTRVNEGKEAYMEDARQSLIKASVKIREKLDPLNKVIEKEFRDLIGSA